jgi:hypothetical protein
MHKIQSLATAEGAQVSGNGFRRNRLLEGQQPIERKAGVVQIALRGPALETAIGILPG